MQTYNTRGTNKLFVIHTREWFVNRIGTTIKRYESAKQGTIYKEQEFDIKNISHALSLYAYQKEFNFRYTENGTA